MRLLSLGSIRLNILLKTRVLIVEVGDGAAYAEAVSSEVLG